VDSNFFGFMDINVKVHVTYEVVQNWMHSRDWNFEVILDIVCQNRQARVQCLPGEFFSRPAKGSFSEV
jgi:hypothetical protein